MKCYSFAGKQAVSLAMLMLVLLFPRVTSAAETVLSFSGTDSYVDLGMPEILQRANNSPLTVEGWVYLNSVDTRDMLYSKSNGRATSGYTHMFGFYTSGRITAYTGGAWREPNPTVTVATKRWVHVAFSFDGTTMTYFVDGAPVGTSPFNYNNVEANTVKLGGYDKSSDLNGMKSDVRVWDHARSADQIQAYMNRRLRGSENGLLGYWPLNEGEAAQEVFDRTTHASMGSISNATWATADDFTLDSLRLVHPVTGSPLFTNTNEVDVTDLTIPPQYSHYQVNFTNDEALLASDGWIAASTPLQQVVFPQPAGDANLTAYVWFTNLNDSVALGCIKGEIFYTVARPVVSIVPTLTRHLVEGFSTIVLALDDLDAGSTGGTADSRAVMLFDRKISSTVDVTPAAPEVTLAATGPVDVVLTVVNEAGNYAAATCTVTLVEGELRTWTGLCSNSLASTAANWSPASVPITGNSVRFDANSPSNCTWDLDIILSEWTQTADYPGTVTFNTVYPGQGSFTNLIIGRDATLLGGVWTHPANTGGATEVDRLAVSVGGSFTLGSTAAINLDGKGFAAATGPGAGTGGSKTGGYSASHGGAGARNPATSGTYGSITCPENLGSGALGPGGGALRLMVGGTAAIDGVISARGINTATASIGNYCHGSGGSILIEADTFAGGGTIRAGIDTAKDAYYGSGGGRIALLCASATTFDGLTLEAKPHTKTTSGGGRAGTIYLETPDTRRLIVDQGNIGTASINHTDLPARLASDDPHPAFDGELANVALTVTNGGFVGLARDLRIGTINWLNGKLTLNSWTLYVRSAPPVGAFPGSYGGGSVVPAGTYYTFANGDTLTRDGRLFWSDSNVTWRAVSVVKSATGGTTAINGGTAEGYFEHGSSLTFQATTNAGYTFIRWDGSLPSDTSSPDNPLVPSPLSGNLALRAWFRDASQDLATNSWVAIPSSDDWFDPLNWSLFAAPTAGQVVIIPDGASLRLAATTPQLARCEVASGAKLTFEGWETALKADEIKVAGTITHEEQTVTAPDSETGEWIPQHRILIEGANLTVTANGEINADYRGYALNCGPGRPPSGLYAGAGHGGIGNGGFGGKRYGPAYGVPEDPWQPGSGGGASSAIRHGGGAICIEMTGAVTVHGTITACGQDGSGSAHTPSASGGSIAITCRTFDGSATGAISADGGRGNYYSGNSAGGRIALHYDPAAQAASENPRPPVRISTYAWFYDSRELYYFPYKAEMGTLYIPDLTLLAETPTSAAVLAGNRFWYTRLYIGSQPESWSPASLIISNCVVAFPDGFSLHVGQDLLVAGTEAPYRGDSRTMRAGLRLYAAATNELYGARLTVGRDLRLEENAWILPHTQGASAAIVGMRVGRNVMIDAAGGIDAVEKGFWSQPGNLNGTGAGKANDAGGAYGGYGGHATASRDVYGSAALPLDPGSPGGWYTWTGDQSSSGHGGGVIHLLCGGDATINGTVTAIGGRGDYYRAGGGSGGSIFLAAMRLSGSGKLLADGGYGEYDKIRAGGGGRIAVWHHIPLAAVEARLVARDISGLAYSAINSAFTGQVSVDPGRVDTPGNATAGTKGFYTIAGTLVILR